MDSAIVGLTLLATFPPDRNYEKMYSFLLERMVWHKDALSLGMVTLSLAHQDILKKLQRPLFRICGG